MKKLTQRDVLALVRKKLPRARQVILDAKTKSRRKRVKSLSYEPTSDSC